MPRAPSTSALLTRLHAIRASYTTEASAEKLALLPSLESRAIRSAAALAAFHGDLLFLRAFPDNDSVHALAGEMLGHFAARVHQLPALHRHTLDDSGITGTTSRHTFAFGIAEWFVRRGERADIDWPNYEQPERLDPLLRQTLMPAEADAFDSGELSTREWVRLARSPETPTDLAWLLAPSPRRHGARAPAPSRVSHVLYESAEVPVAWQLTGSTAASGNAIPGIIPVARSAMRRLPPSAPALIARPMRIIEDPLALGAPFPAGAIVRLAPARAKIWIDVARAALAAICREVHAITYANEDEVYVADLGEGTAVCVIGVAPGERLTLETNYGHVLFANGVPIGYGGVTPLAAQANTGINIFAAFRQSEAACLFAHALRAFRSLFRVTRFVVNPYQFGAGNDEALASGAYWFYDRLGFRPVEPSVRTIADGERERLAADRNNRSDRETLRALASCDVVLELPGARSTALFDERWLVTLATDITRRLASSSAAERAAIASDLTDAVARTLELQRWRSLPPAERAGFERLAPLMALVLDDIARWPAADRGALAAMMRAKGSPQERDFALLARDHSRFWKSLGRKGGRADRRTGGQADGRSQERNKGTTRNPT